MAKYRVLHSFIDAQTKRKYAVGEIIEFTVKRATEAENNLKQHGLTFIERLNEEKE